ncbi:MAG: response regulator [Anaerolineae bacterium]|nr:response regulator [Anaerolineae bacterium]
MASILVVEDHDILRTVMVLTLQQAGYTTLEARSGRDALQHLTHNTRISLLITDLNMPEVGGLRLIETVQRDYAALPIVVISSFPRGIWVGNTAIQKVAQYLLKPVKQRQLLETVRLVINSAFVV